MKIYRYPVKANPWADQVKVSRTKEGKWLIVRGNNWTELAPETFTNSPRNWTYALWTGIAWANQELQEREAIKHAEYFAAEKLGAAVPLINI